MWLSIRPSSGFYAIPLGLTGTNRLAMIVSHRALIRAKQQIDDKLDRNELRKAISSLERLAAATKNPHPGVPKNGHITFVATKDIDWIEAEGNYVRLQVGDCEHELRETLTELEKRLSPSDFFRIHRSTIVNIHRIKEIQPWFYGYHRLLLENRTELRMSR